MTKSKSSSRPNKSATIASAESASQDASSAKSDSANASPASTLEVAAPPEDATSAKNARKQKLEFEGSMSRTEAFAQLDALAKGLEKGKIEIQAKGQSVSLSPSHHFDLELKASTKGSKERISIELSWRADCEPDQKLKVIADSKDS